jgi:iron complex outermembrane recepter protein
MKFPPRKYLLIAGILAIPSALAHGQGEAEDVFELSPFTVSADAEVGYTASETTMGSRLRQPIKDIAAQIEVITVEMIEDFNITSAEDAFRYSANVENVDEYISPRDGGDAAAWGGKEIGRIRGVQPSSFSTSRNFFSSITSSDVYNIRNISIASGAQSLLFSLGEPAGIANVELRQAEMRDFGRFSSRVDSQDGYRFTLDVNRSLIDQKLAVRMAALFRDNPNFIKPSYDRETRYYGTLTYRPFSRTTVRFHIEDVSNVSNRSIRHLPWDWATPFFIAQQQGTLDQLQAAPFGAIQNSAAYIYGANDAPLEYVHWRTNLIPISPGQLPVDPDRFGGAFDPNTGVVRVTFNPDNINLIPEAAANLGRNFFGNNVRNHNDSRIYNAFIEQRILPDLTLELAGHWEKWELRNQSVLNYSQFGYKADMNQFFPTDLWRASTAQPNANTPGFVPNPNFGKVYASSTPNGLLRMEDSRELRASLAWEPEFVKRHRWMGEHSFLAAFNTRRSTDKVQGMQVRITNPTVDYQNFSGPMNNARRLMILHHYFDMENLSVGAPFGGALSVDQFFRGFEYVEPTTGEVLRFGGWGDETGGARPDGNKVEIDSLVAAWQGKFWRDRVILSYGARRDDVTQTLIDRSPGGANQLEGNAWRWIYDIPFDPDSAISQEETSHTYGAVLRPLPNWSLAYYESSTFNLPSGNMTPFGDPIPGSNGMSKDYSIRYDAPDGSFYFKLNKYEVVQRDNNIGFGGVRINALRMESSYQNVTDRRANLVPGEPDYYTLIVDQGLTGNAVTADTPLNDGQYPIIGDIVSEGYELTAGLSWNNFNFRLTFAQNETLNQNSSKDWERWIAGRLPHWSSVLNAEDENWTVIPYDGPQAENYATPLPDGSVRPMTLQEFYNNVVLVQQEVARQLDGRPVDTSRKYRANLLVSYHFRDGILNNIRTGAAFRWRSKPIIGFPLIELPNPDSPTPLPGLDLDNPFKGKELFDTDVFVRYNGRNFLGTGMRYNVQFNVRNLLTSSGTYRTGRVNARGESVFTVIEEPRYYVLSLDLNF